MTRNLRFNRTKKERIASANVCSHSLRLFFVDSSLPAVPFAGGGGYCVRDFLKCNCRS
ncbi:hypothetical protein AGR8A_Cc40133 [Agrobacterium fabrum str. J-07]|nr:hypothetical protein AGR8A_Cc40133 [Agrobacterium fabrum str. J-07]